MKFSSLKPFKKTILEHNVCIGREVRFEKNDANRCMVVSKDKKYVTMFSRAIEF